jgi:hypothetical protein
MGKDMIKELAAGGVFENYADIFVCFDYVI